MKTLTVPRPTFARPTAARGKRRHARSAVFAGLLAVVVANVGLGLTAELYPRVRDPMFGDKLAKLRPMLQTPGRGPLVLALGSSRTIYGFHAGRIEGHLQALGRPAVVFNFGVSATGPIAHLVYARRLFRDGVTPDLLLLEVLPSMFADRPGGPQEQAWLYGDRLTCREVDTVTGFGFEPVEVRRRWREATLTPWYGLRFQLMGRVLQSWIPWLVRYDGGRNTDPHGWGTPVLQHPTPQQRRESVALAHGEYAALLHDWTPTGPAADALRTLLQECRERGVPVKLVLMPEGSAFCGWYSPAVRERLAAFLRSLDCDLIDAREWLADDQFIDDHHQLIPGAEAFSDRLTRDVILPWLGGAK